MQIAFVQCSIQLADDADRAWVVAALAIPGSGVNRPSETFRVLRRQLRFGHQALSFHERWPVNRGEGLALTGHGEVKCTVLDGRNNTLVRVETDHNDNAIIWRTVVRRLLLFPNVLDVSDSRKAVV